MAGRDVTPSLDRQLSADAAPPKLSASSSGRVAAASLQHLQRPLVLCLLVLGLVQARGEVQLEAQPKAYDSKWMAIHARLNEQASSMKQADVIFYGDSITEGWLGLFKGMPNPLASRNKKVFASLAARLGANMQAFGIAGDKVENLLWRMQYGEFPEALSLRVAVIGIGINDLLSGSNPDEVADKVTNLSVEMSKAHPKTKILVLGLLPESSGNASRVPDTRTELVNHWLHKSLQGIEDVQFLDCTNWLIDRTGKLHAYNYVQDSVKFLHFSARGYSSLSDCLYKKLKNLLHSS